MIFRKHADRTSESSLQRRLKLKTRARDGQKHEIMPGVVLPCAQHSEYKNYSLCCRHKGSVMN